MPKTNEEIIPSPDESPSMPSIKLKEFIIKSITKIVQTTDEIQDSECIPNKPCKPLSRMLQ